MPATDRQPVSAARNARWETSPPIETFLGTLDLARSGISIATLQLEPAHLRVIARLVALRRDVPGLFGALATHFDRTVQLFVHDRETERFLLAAARAVDTETLVAGLAAVVGSAEAMSAPLVDDPAFRRLYLEDRYYLVLGDLNVRVGQTARIA